MHAWLNKKLKLSHHRHSGRLLPHTHTSHGALLVLVIAAGAMLFMATGKVAADIQQSGDISVSGFVPGPPPSEAAKIIKPKNGQTFSDSPIEIRGTCPDGVVVEIYKNGILAGSTSCVNGDFTLMIDLVKGLNRLIAKVVDSLGQYGPDSAPVTVTYKPIAPVTPPGAGPAVRQFVISIKNSYFGGLANQIYSLEITVAGGKAPYALSVDWGDGNDELVSREEDGSFKLTHQYENGGLYYLKVTGSDKTGAKAYAQSTAIIGGPEPGSVVPDSPIFEEPSLLIIWPLYVVTLFFISAFWLGEKYEHQKLKRLWKTSKRAV